MSYIVKVIDSWDIRAVDHLGPYGTIGTADHLAQRIRSEDRDNRYSVQVVELRGSASPYDYMTGDHYPACMCGECRAPSTSASDEAYDDLCAQRSAEFGEGYGS